MSPSCLENLQGHVSPVKGVGLTKFGNCFTSRCWEGVCEGLGGGQVVSKDPEALNPPTV